MKITLLLITLVISSSLLCIAQRNTPRYEIVKFEVIDLDSNSATIEIKLPLVTSTGGTPTTAELVRVVKAQLADKDIDCPLKRKKITDNTWLCGNGKTITTSNSKLKTIFSEIWDASK